MSEKRYSMYTAAKVIGTTHMAVRNRAIKLGINTSAGLTAKDVKAIMEYKCETRYAKRYKVEDLKSELGVLNG